MRVFAARSILGLSEASRWLPIVLLRKPVHGFPKSNSTLLFTLFDPLYFHATPKKKFDLSRFLVSLFVSRRRAGAVGFAAQLRAGRTRGKLFWYAILSFSLLITSAFSVTTRVLLGLQILPVRSARVGCLRIQPEDIFPFDCIVRPISLMVAKLRNNWAYFDGLSYY